MRALPLAVTLSAIACSASPPPSTTSAPSSMSSAPGTPTSTAPSASGEAYACYSAGDPVARLHCHVLAGCDLSWSIKSAVEPTACALDAAACPTLRAAFEDAATEAGMALQKTELSGGPKSVMLGIDGALVMAPIPGGPKLEALYQRLRTLCPGSPSPF